MSFISFNEKYYRRKLLDYENRILSDADIYEAKQILKMLDDLTDEGYTNLTDTMEANFSCLTRLRSVLHIEKKNANNDPDKKSRSIFAETISNIYNEN